MAGEQQQQRGRGRAQAAEAKRQWQFPLPGSADSGVPPGAGYRRDLQQAISSLSLSARGSIHGPQKHISRAPQTARQPDSRCTSFH